MNLAFLGTASAQLKDTDAAADVTVHLHNSIVATPGVVERAKQVAKSMFAPVGVNVRWRNSDSELPEGLSVDMVLVGSEPGEEEAGPLAEAFPFAGTMGHIVVLYDRVRSASGISRDLEPVLLAHVMVHEMTHVLQCLDRHSDTGIMKSHWSSDDYCDMRWKLPLTFTAGRHRVTPFAEIQMLRSRDATGSDNPRHALSAASSLPAKPGASKGRTRDTKVELIDAQPVGLADPQLLRIGIDGFGACTPLLRSRGSA